MTQLVTRAYSTNPFFGGGVMRKLGITEINSKEQIVKSTRYFSFGH